MRFDPAGLAAPESYMVDAVSVVIHEPTSAVVMRET
jgi:hypothetical protein